MGLLIVRCVLPRELGRVESSPIAGLGEVKLLWAKEPYRKISRDYVLKVNLRALKYYRLSLA